MKQAFTTRQESDATPLQGRQLSGLLGIEADRSIVYSGSDTRSVLGTLVFGPVWRKKDRLLSAYC
jgi:hypothetical protein